MCSWATALFLSCLMSLMDIGWNRSLKQSCLLLLTALSVIQRLINGIQQHLQGKQEQVKRQKGLLYWWRLFALVMISSFFNQMFWFNTDGLCLLKQTKVLKVLLLRKNPIRKYKYGGDVCTLQYLSSLVSCCPPCWVRKFWHSFGLLWVPRQELGTV